MNLDDPLTEKRVAKLLMRDRYSKHVVLPCYTPAGWWENDVFMLSDSGYWWEFEIKLTLADFRRDAEKTRTAGQWDARLEEKKHALLAGGERGPTCFYYVAPIGVIPLDQLPTWAGLIEIKQDGKYLYEMGPAVKAPRRHTQKADPAIRAHVMETCYWRLHRAGH